MPLKLTNTLTRRKEDFVPATPGLIGVYVCGPTVYGPPHLGHAKTAVAFDVIVRWLRRRFESTHRVRFVQNITDVGHLVADADEGEDKVQAEARRRGLEPMEVAAHWEREYVKAVGALGCRPPDITPRATGHIPEQIALTRRLLEAGAAYEVNGSVYFDVAKFAGYGKLSGRKVDEAESGTRVTVLDEKRHPADFALWKRADPGHLMQWESPWGRGFPGWHVECSAMSMKYLGETFDIHGGGMDLKFPHHEAEIAQSEAATGRPFARVWMHGGLVTLNGAKMAKSQGNYITLSELFAGPESVDEARRGVLRLSQAYAPAVLRLLILQTHYAANLDISDGNLAAAAAGLAKLLRGAAALRNAVPDDVKPGPEAAAEPAWAAEFATAFDEAMDDDFNTPRALAAVYGFVSAREADLAAGTLHRRNRDLALDLLRRTAGDVLGIDPDADANAAAERVLKPVLDAAVEARGELRKAGADLLKKAKAAAKDPAALTREIVAEIGKALFASSDEVRRKLADAGVTLEDGPDGTRWKL